MKILNLFRKKKKIGCPACYEEKIISFGIDLLETKYDSKIELYERIGDIQIFKCSKCNSEFYKENQTFQKILKGQIDFLKVYFKNEQKISSELKSQIDLIGETKDWNMNNLIPAKIELKNGEIYDFATIRISNNPPIGYYFEHFEKIIFIDEIKSINSSEFGISREIREKAENAEEMRMGFYPIVLTTKNGVKIVINGQALFFKNGEIKGSDLLLSDDTWNHKEKYIYENKIDNQVLVIAKK